MAAIFAFGPFRLDVDAGVLFQGAEVLPVGRRGVALLALLLERAGAPVPKEALIEAAWPALAIEDSNLTVQIAALRRVFDNRVDGASWIETLPRRGYRYAGPLVTNAGFDLLTRGSEPKLPDQPSIAVLPFANLSDDPTQDYFADGMVDDIITGLARIKSLFVIARNSTLTYKGRAVDVKQVGRELGVRYVLEGSVRRVGNRVRVISQMIDALTGVHVWAERYDRIAEDIFALQDEIALSAVGAISTSVRQAEIERVQRKRPESLDAYDLVMRAQRDVDSGMPQKVTQALALLERAIELEPDYALAQGNAAMCHHCLFLRAGWHEANRAASIDHARSAILHGQDDAAALTLAGFSIGMDGRDHGAAFTAFESALAISPSSALTYILGSVILGWCGDAERAIEWSDRGMRLSPFDPWAFAAFDAQAMSHMLRGRYDEACRAAYKAVHANSEHSITHVQLAAALAKLGRLEEARGAATRVLELHPTFRYNRQFAGVNCAPALAAVLGDALQLAGLPE
ncbi:MAG: winged helix-turn-helix domain-containing protein [Paracoccaceae bacterium]